MSALYLSGKKASRANGSEASRLRLETVGNAREAVVAVRAEEKLRHLPLASNNLRVHTAHVHRGQRYNPYRPVDLESRRRRESSMAPPPSVAARRENKKKVRFVDAVFSAVAPTARVLPPLQQQQALPAQDVAGLTRATAQLRINLLRQGRMRNEVNQGVRQHRQDGQHAIMHNLALLMKHHLLHERLRRVVVAVEKLRRREISLENFLAFVKSAYDLTQRASYVYV
ncbi:hypothetical protein JCM8547_004819 [Rhodosporidiobolus lusitaniae]